MKRRESFNVHFFLTCVVMCVYPPKTIAGHSIFCCITFLRCLIVVWFTKTSSPSASPFDTRSIGRSAFSLSLIPLHGNSSDSCVIDVSNQSDLSFTQSQPTTPSIPTTGDQRSISSSSPCVACSNGGLTASTDVYVLLTNRTHACLKRF